MYELPGEEEQQENTLQFINQELQSRHRLSLSEDIDNSSVKPEQSFRLFRTSLIPSSNDKSRTQSSIPAFEIGTLSGKDKQEGPVQKFNRLQFEITEFVTELKALSNVCIPGINYTVLQYPLHVLTFSSL